MKGTHIFRAIFQQRTLEEFIFLVFKLAKDHGFFFDRLAGPGFFVKTIPGPLELMLLNHLLKLFSERPDYLMVFGPPGYRGFFIPQCTTPPNIAILAKPLGCLRHMLARGNHGQANSRQKMWMFVVGSLGSS